MTERPKNKNSGSKMVLAILKETEKEVDKDVLADNVITAGQEFIENNIQSEDDGHVNLFNPESEVTVADLTAPKIISDFTTPTV